MAGMRPMMNMMRHQDTVVPPRVMAWGVLCW